LLAQYLVPLSIIAAVGALATLTVAFLVARRLGETRAALNTVAAQLDDAAATLPSRIRDSRAMLAEQGAAAEHALWTMQQYDRQLDKMSVRLASGGKSIDEMHESLERARTAVARLVSATRLIMRAVELRRAILG
jgi:methyl-accepting chemotaxis protein